MIANQIIQSVDFNGRLCIDLPELAGKTLKVFYFPIKHEDDGYDSDDQDFIAASYLAAIEDDEEEDEIWEKFIK